MNTQKIVCLWIAMLTLIILSINAYAATIIVPDDYLTIRRAILAATDGDHVLVRDGTYSERINFRGKAITVSSENGPETTIIGGDVGTFIEVVTFDSDEGTDSVLEGFTILGDYVSDNIAIYCLSASPTIRNCIISNFAGSSYGDSSGIALINSQANIIDCIISGNYSYYFGGGISLWDNSLPTITGCIISENDAGFGGGIFLSDTSSAIITNCIISKNIAGHFSGIDSRNSIILTNCIISKNVTASQYDTGVLGMSDSIVTNCTITGNFGTGIDADHSTEVVNSIVWGNSEDQIKGHVDITYSNIEGGYEGTGNIDADPRFMDTANSNYRLQADSPCIDAGDPNSTLPENDIEGISRPQPVGGRYDMGAYEHIPCDTPITYYRDADGDGLGNPEISITVCNPEPNYVANDNDNDDSLKVGVSGYPYTSIQEAIDCTVNGDAVYVHNGTYFENIDFKGKEIMVRSKNGAALTIIDGNTQATVVTFKSLENRNSILDGFTIRNGKGDFSYDSGGIYCKLSSPTIINCNISENYSRTSYCGGGIGCYYYSSPRIINCTISKNRVEDDSAGGIFCHYSSPHLINCTISENTASGPSSNGGIYARWDSSPTVVNSILWGDTAEGVLDEIYIYGDSKFTIRYSDIQGGYEGNGNIDIDPLFAGSGNYHLTVDSPCIDAGTNNVPRLPYTDFDGDTRIIDGDIDGNAIVDIGSDEYVPSVTPLIDRYIPSYALPGRLVKIIGENFGTSQADSIVTIGRRMFDSTSSNIILWIDTQIVIRIPRYPVRWFMGQESRLQRVWVTINGIDSNIKILKVANPLF